MVGVGRAVLGLRTFFTDQAAQGPIQPGIEPFQQWEILFQGLTTLTVKSCIPSISLWSKTTAPRTVTTCPLSLSCTTHDLDTAELRMLETCLSSSDILILLPFSLVQLKSQTVLPSTDHQGKQLCFQCQWDFNYCCLPKAKWVIVFWVSTVMFIAWPKRWGGSALG